MATQQILTGAIEQSNPSLSSQITTYGALVLPFDVKEFLNKNKPQVDPETQDTFKGQLRSALKLSPNENLIKGALKSPLQTFETLSQYMKDERSQMNKLTTIIGSKFSGIAVAQALASGKVSSREALDYLFMGFAPALGVQGSLMGYSGLTQLKDALMNGSIDVGSFISGFTRTLKGAVDLKDMLSNKEGRLSNDIVEIDLTLSHSENYQSETPDRRVQSGQSLNEYIHNMPDTFEIQCALQEGKRYSKAEFRAIIQEVRNTKGVISLVLGEEMFDNLIITNFSPNHNCSKSGMDYTLSFKKITRSDIERTEVIISLRPEGLEENDQNGILSSGGGSSSNTGMPNMSNLDPLVDASNIAQKSVSKIKKAAKGKSLLKALDSLRKQAEQDPLK